MNKRFLSKTCAILCTACITFSTLSQNQFFNAIESLQPTTVLANVPETPAPALETPVPKKVSALYIQYIGPVITAPTTLSSSDFLVTAVYEDGSRGEIKTYTFTSGLQITEEGETCISVSYENKTASCLVSYYTEKKEEYFSIVFDSCGGSDLAPILSILPGSNVTFSKIPEKKGFWFRGWYTENTYQTEFTSNYKVNDNLMLYAKWEAKENPDKDTMSTTVSFPDFTCKLNIDLTGQSYGYLVNPVCKAIQNERVSDAAKNISRTAPFFAFHFDVTDYSFNNQNGLLTGISLPNDFNPATTIVYFTPDEKTIQGACRTERVTQESYNFYAYEPGTYIVMDLSREANTEIVETVTPPSIQLKMDSQLFVDSQTSATILFFDLLEDEINPEEIVFKWHSSDPSIATVNDEGIITALAPGIAEISVTSQEPQLQATGTITVKNKVQKTIYISKLTLKKTKLTLKKGKQFTIKATVSPSKASNKKLKYTSTNKKIATVSSKGIIKAQKKGTCYIKVSTTDGSKITKKIKVTVKNK